MQYQLSAIDMDRVLDGLWKSDKLFAVIEVRAFNASKQEKKFQKDKADK